MQTLNNTQKLQFINEIGGSVEIKTVVLEDTTEVTKMFRSFEGDTFTISDEIIESIEEDMSHEHNVLNDEVVSFIPDSLVDGDTFSQFFEVI